LSQYATMLLNKVIETDDVDALTRFNITEADMPTTAEKQVYKFIVDYAKENRGKAPSYATVVSECPAFDYIPDVSDSYGYLTKQVKSLSAKLAFSQLLTPSEDGKDRRSVLEKNYQDLDGEKFLEWLQTNIDSIIMRTSVRESIGKTMAEIKESFLSEYYKREEGKSFKRWDTPFESLTEEIGGWFSGDVYGIMAESGRGKTYLICKIVDSLLRQGATVLVKSFEVKEYVWIARLVSIATAVDELLLDELGRKVGLPNKQILSGSLDGVTREEFIKIVETLDSYYPGTFYFQGKSDPALTRTLNDLDSELSRVKVDAVVLDPFYGLTDVYGKNANKTAGGAAEQAATRFEQIIGDHDVVGIYAVQATVEKKQMDETDTRELNLPTRDQVKTSKRLLDIATNLIAFDSVEKEGVAMLGIEKGRNGGEDFTLQLLALFDYGVLTEMPTGAESVAQFADF